MKKTHDIAPHVRAAQRELENRRIGVTPSRARRKSGKQQRETPRDDLRTLSRLLASKTQPMISTPEASAPIPVLDGEYDDDGDEIIPQPRLSLALEDDEDDSLLLPPRSAGLEDENFTVQSIELARRATNENDIRRISRGSFGSTRMSDAFADLSKVGLKYDGDQSSYLDGFAESNNFIMENDDKLPNEDTRMLYSEGLPFHKDRESGVRLGRALVEDNDTFILTVPHRSETLTRLQTDHTIENEAAQRFDVTDVQNSSGFTDLHTSLNDMATQDKAYKVPRKKARTSKYGINYPLMPAGFVKKMAINFAKTAGESKANIANDTLDAVMQATDWFFEQMSDDLKAYAKHAGRKTIDESDVYTLMARQRQIDSKTTPFSLAQRYLPRELLQEIRMDPQ